MKARYEVRSGRRIALTFEEAGIGDIHISKELEQLLAPALLPRTWFNHRLLLGIREVLPSLTGSFLKLSHRPQAQILQFFLQ